MQVAACYRFPVLAIPSHSGVVGALRGGGIGGWADAIMPVYCWVGSLRFDATGRAFCATLDFAFPATAASIVILDTKAISKPLYKYVIPTSAEETSEARANGHTPAVPTNAVSNLLGSSSWYRGGPSPDRCRDGTTCLGF
jgi:hypothetical protein